jgi:hypothetical protein
MLPAWIINEIKKDEEPQVLHIGDEYLDRPALEDGGILQKEDTHNWRPRRGSTHVPAQAGPIRCSPLNTERGPKWREKHAHAGLIQSVSGHQ